MSLVQFEGDSNIGLRWNWCGGDWAAATGSIPRSLGLAITVTSIWWLEVTWPGLLGVSSPIQPQSRTSSLLNPESCFITVSTCALSKWSNLVLKWMNFFLVSDRSSANSLHSSWTLGMVFFSNWLNFISERLDLVVESCYLWLEGGVQMVLTRGS